MKALIIRKARKEELKTIQELNHQLFICDGKYDPSYNMNWPFEKVGEDFFRNKINEKEGICFVAEIDNKIVGYLAGSSISTYSYRTINKMTELVSIFVKEEFRGEGIGEKLFQKLVDWSKCMKADRIKVSASADNSRGIKFYERVGFKPYASELEYEIK